MDNFEALITSVKPNALQSVDRTVQTDIEFSNENMREKIRERAEKLLGIQAVDFLDETGVTLEAYIAHTNAFGKLGVGATLSFNYLNRIVIIYPAEYHDLYEDRNVHGLAIDFAFDRTSSESRGFAYGDFGATEKELTSESVKFLRFMGNFVEKISNNLIITPSSERRKRIYTRFFEQHNPLRYTVYVGGEKVEKPISQKI